MATKPRYQIVKDHILDGIENGSFAVDDRVPSEAQLVDTLGVSRMTANRALNELTQAGVLVRLVGVGTFVADRRVHGDLLTVRDIADELAEKGHTHTMDVLAQRRVVANADLAERFELRPGAELIQARIRHRRDGVPVLLEDRFVNAAQLPEYEFADLSSVTSYCFLMRRAPLDEVEHAIRAITPSAEVLRVLELAASEPCLAVQRRTWSRNAVVSVVTLYYAGSRYEISGRFKPEQ